MNYVYPSSVDAFLSGTIDITTDTIKAELLEGYVRTDADEWLADIDGATRFGDPVTVTVSGVLGGTVAFDGLTFPSVPAGNTADSVIIYVDGADDATSLLLVLYADGADGTPLSIVTDDGDIQLSWSRGAFKL